MTKGDTVKMAELYAINCRDKPNSKEKRMAGLKAHLAHMDEVFDRVSIACPLLDEDGDFAGSMLVISATDMADAQAFIEQDPYYDADIWDSIQIDRVGVTAGSWVGGKPW
jgi:uncharacterized protein YciI